jgi:hypothetical protein
MQISRTAAFVCAVFAAAAIVQPAAADEPNPRISRAKVDGTPLRFLVNELNRKAAEDPIGKDQPQLTEDEIVGEIYAATLEGHEMNDETAKIYRKIAETRTLPADADLYFMTHWVMQGQADFTVWWVNLDVKVGEKSGYALRVRRRIISGRPVQKGGGGVRIEFEK